MILNKSLDYTQNWSVFGYVGQKADGGDGTCNAEQDTRRGHQGSFSGRFVQGR